jgi:putative flippase GtrA
MSGQFLRFLSTGGVAAIVNLLSRYELNKIMSFEAAVALAYLIGMLTAYVLARRFVFQASGRSVASELKRFTIVNVFSLAFVWSISIGLANYLFPAIGFVWHADDIAHFIGVAAPAAASYFGHRAYTFSSIRAVDPVEGVGAPSVRGDPVN